jgi:hypothetical protein
MRYVDRRRLLLTAYASATGIAARVVCGGEDDPIAAALRAVQEKHAVALVEAREILFRNIDGIVKEFASVGDLDTVQDLLKQRKAAEVSGTLPGHESLRDMSSSYYDALQAADDMLEEAYKIAEADYTRAMQFEQAEQTRKESRRFLEKANVRKRLNQPRGKHDSARARPARRKFVSPILGRWRWFIDGQEADPVEFRADETVIGGGPEGTWHMANRDEGRYVVTWENNHVDVLTMSTDGRTMTGGTIIATRVEGFRLTEGVRELIQDFVPTRDIVSGKWKKIGGGIQSDDTSPARIRLPIAGKMPDQYDFTVEFTPLGGDLTVSQLMHAHGAGFSCDFGGWHNTIVALQLVDGRNGDANRTTHRRRAWLIAGRRHRAMIAVRRDSVAAILNDQRVCQLPTDFKNLRFRDGWAIPERGLGIGSFGTPTVFHRATLLPR